MPVYSDIRFYDLNPLGFFSTTVGGTTIYTGPDTPAGVATITDNEAGADDLSLQDDFGTTGGESATANVTINGLTSTGSPVDSEDVWTLRDTVTGQEFQIVTFEVEQGPAQGFYLLSEVPLIEGREYETLAYDSFPLTSAGDPVFTYEDFFDNQAVDGDDTDDTIDLNYVDLEGDRIDNGDGTGPNGEGDLVFAGDGDDRVEAGDGDDIVYGQGDDDTLLGEDGDDILFGDSGVEVAPVTEFLDWTAQGGSGTSLETDFTQTTGTMDVSVSFEDVSAGSTAGAEVSTSTQYNEAGEPFDDNSGLLLEGTGGPAGGSDVSITTIDFDPVAGSGMSDEVENVEFRINDIDSGGWIDRVTITGINAAGEEVDVTFTIAGNETIENGDTIVGGAGGDEPFQAAGSVLVQIDEPVTQIVISYGNGGTTGQFIWISDIYFDTIPEGGDDFLDGGLGADTLYGEGGDDTFTVADGDTAFGGSGDDVFTVTDLGEGSSDITIVGGEGGETQGDTLFFGGLIDSLDDITFTNTDDDAGGLSGSVLLNNGTTVTFSEIENLEICFATGTLIDTPCGPMPVEQIQAGTTVNTVDHGPQTVIWSNTNDRPLDGTDPDQKPILIQAGALGRGKPMRDLVVSPQHRVLVGENGQLTDYFDRPALVAAKALVSLPGIRHMRGKRAVTWHHFAFRKHQIVRANGCLAESLLLGQMVQKSLPAAERAALQSLFAVAPAHDALNGPAARDVLKTGQVARILRQRTGQATQQAA